MASSPAVHYTTKLLLLVFFLFAFATEHQTALGAVTSCPSGWAFHQGNCYRAQLPPLLGGYTYATAQAACQQIGGNLASLHNQAEAAFVTALYNAATNYGLLGAQNGLFYIGANYSVSTAVGAGTPGIASWQDGSSVADAPYNWGPPVDPSGDCSPYDCVVVYSIMNNGGAHPSENGQWNDVCCSYTFDAGLNARVGAMCKQGASHCPLGWTYYDGNCYRPDFSQVSTTTVSHAAAEQTCQSQGAHLTSVHSLAEWMFLRSLSALQPPSINGKIFGYYNGLRVEWTGNAISSANWTDNTLVNFGSPIGYPANGQPAGTIPWASGSPNPSNTNELCGMQWGLCPTCSSTWGDFGRWNDVGCTFNVGLVTLQPMCKKPLV